MIGSNYKPTQDVFETYLREAIDGSAWTDLLAGDDVDDSLEAVAEDPTPGNIAAARAAWDRFVRDNPELVG